MEELIGRKIRVYLNSLSGVITSTGILIKIEGGFIKLEISNGRMLYLSIANIKTIELV
ncbi:MAG: hypothetical protein WC088_03280 [Candidatus Izemoplasmatales bacterium]|jgi:hypothetical protein|nr:hypothetical protein [Candidatus Izemoplasmatales bacterium]MDD4595477.1 hypothetical protein [Candidatus Izemoplasmatales bacterium]